MARATIFDPAPYMRPPRLDVRQAVSLSIALLSALPKNAGPSTKKAARRLRSAAQDLQTAWSHRQRAASPRPTEKVKADRRIDGAWGALKARLEAYGWLPADFYPRAPRAEELVASVFPTGLDFLTLPMNEEWFESNERLKRIKNENLDAEIDALAGPEFLVEVRAAHEQYGAVLGITQAQSLPPDSTVLLGPLRAVVAAMGDYLLQIIASVDREAPETIESARKALLPVDRFREDALRRAADKSQKPGSLDDTVAEDAEQELPAIDPDEPELAKSP
jgi:hypothetical protein